MPLDARAGVALAIAMGTVLGAAAGASERTGRDWPRWRGADGSGVSDETGLPHEWSATRNVRWKTAIPGRGHSSPIVWGNRIFLTTSVEGPVVPGARAVTHIGWQGEDNYVHPDSVGADRRQTLQVLALDADTGAIVWERTAYDGTVIDNRHRKNTYASASVVTDGKYVIASFESEGVYAYDVNGAPVWKQSLGAITKGGMGPGTSPVLFEDLVILQCDQELGAGSFIVALDKRTGRQAWRVERKHRRSWATPIFVEAGGRTEMIASGAESVIAYDPRTGRELWRANGVESHPIPSAVTAHGLVLLSAGSGAKRALAIRPGGNGDVSDTAVVWRYNKGTAYVPSPIAYGDYLYLMTDKGLLTCLDARTGKLEYEGGRVPVPATFTASIVAFDGKLLLTSEDGDTFVVKAGPVHEVLATNPLGEPVYASPAVSRGRIYIRGERHLYAIERQSATTP
jgi:outer membrane protein assembly factor BamB